jgi:DNA (cytosine-5)-methyltransferase 1
MNELATEQSPMRCVDLFAGAGGGLLAGHLLGWRTVCAVEWDSFAASVLVQRQNDGLLPAFPIWDDVQTFTGTILDPFRGVDVVAGGFPCQDISSAGKGAGIDGKKSGMFQHMARIVGEIRPRYVFVENSPLLVGRGLARVLGSLAEMGYDARWGVLGARDAGAPHKRDRIWIVGSHSDRGRLSLERKQEHGREQGSRGGEFDGLCTGGRREGEDVAHSMRSTGTQRGDDVRVGGESELGAKGNAGTSSWEFEPQLGRVADGVAHRVDRLKCIGNGQVPQCAALAWRILTEDRE